MDLRTLILLIALTGCASPSVAPQDSASQAAAESAKPAELAELDRMLGTWNGVAHSTILETGEVYEVRSKRLVQWEANGQFLMERTLTSVEGGPPTSSVCIWTWDRDAFRSWRFDSHGTIHERRMHWNADRNALLMEMTSQLRGEAEPSSAKGVMRFLSETEKTYEWTRCKPGSDEPWVKIKGESTRVSP